MISKFFNYITHHVGRIFLSGLLTLLPFMLTTLFIAFFYRLIDSWVAPVYALEPQFLQAIPGSGLVIVLIGIFLVGLIIKLFLLEPLVHSIEKIVARVPLVRPVYGGIKQLVSAFGNQEQDGAFQKVVMIHFPHNAVYSIGFLTSELPAWVNPSNGDKLYNVFVPTTPNPTGGFLVQVPESGITVTSLTRQEAMSLIISGGIIKPTRPENSESTL